MYSKQYHKICKFGTISNEIMCHSNISYFLPVHFDINMYQ